MLGPNADDRLGPIERLLDHLVKGLAGPDLTVPPHGPPVARERLSQGSHPALVLTRVAEKNVNHESPNDALSSELLRLVERHIDT